MERIAASLFVALLVAAGLAGCLSATSSGPDAVEAPADGPVGRAAIDLARPELEERRITVTPEAGSWAVVRFTAGQLFGDADEANLTIVSDPADGASPYLGGLFHAAMGGETFSLSAWTALPETPDAHVVEMQRSGPGPVDPSIAFVLGSNEAPTTYHLGLTEGVPARGGTSEDIQASVLERRPALNVTPDAAGRDGAAGTVKVTNTRAGVTVVELGNLAVDHDAPPGPLVDVDGTVTVHGEGQVPDGIAGVLVSGSGQAGVGAWELDVDLGATSLGGEGHDLDPDAVSGRVPHTAREMLGIQNPLALASVETGPGPATLDYERSYTGVGRETTVTWGWASLDPAEVYGWNWTDVSLGL